MESFQVIFIYLATSIIGFILGMTFVFRKSKVGVSPLSEEIFDSIKESSRFILRSQLKIITFFSLGFGGIIFFVISRKVSISFFIGVCCAFFMIYLSSYLSNKITLLSFLRNFPLSLENTDTLFKDIHRFTISFTLITLTASLAVFGITYFVLFYASSLQFKNVMDIISNLSNPLSAFVLGYVVVLFFYGFSSEIYNHSTNITMRLYKKIIPRISPFDLRNPLCISPVLKENAQNLPFLNLEFLSNCLMLLIAFIAASFLLRDIALITFAFLILAWLVVSFLLSKIYHKPLKNKSEGYIPIREVGFGIILFLIGSLFFSIIIYKDVKFFFCILGGLIISFLTSCVLNIFSKRKLISQSILPIFYQFLLIGFIIIFSFKLCGVVGIIFSSAGACSLYLFLLPLYLEGKILQNCEAISKINGVKRSNERNGSIKLLFSGIENRFETVLKFINGSVFSSSFMLLLSLVTVFSLASSLKWINILREEVMIGLLLGGAMPFIYIYFILKAIINSTKEISKDIDRQFKEIPGLKEGRSRSDYLFSTKLIIRSFSNKALMSVSFFILMTFLIGFLLSNEALGSFMLGCLVSGFPLFILLTNSKILIKEGYKSELSFFLSSLFKLIIIFSLVMFSIIGKLFIWFRGFF